MSKTTANADSILKLLAVSDDDIRFAKTRTGLEYAADTSDIQGELSDFLDAVQGYEASIANLELAKADLNHTVHVTDGRAAVEAADRKRTAFHNHIITQLSVLNRLCSWLWIPEILPDVQNMDRKDVAFAVFDMQAELWKKLY